MTDTVSVLASTADKSSTSIARNFNCFGNKTFRDSVRLVGKSLIEIQAWSCLETDFLLETVPLKSFQWKNLTKLHRSVKFFDRKKVLKMPLLQSDSSRDRLKTRFCWIQATFIVNKRKRSIFSIWSKSTLCTLLIGSHRRTGACERPAWERESDSSRPIRLPFQVGCSTRSNSPKPIDQSGSQFILESHVSSVCFAAVRVMKVFLRAQPAHWSYARR